MPDDFLPPAYHLGKSLLIAGQRPVVSPERQPLSSQLASLTERLLRERFSPAAVVIDATFEILYFCGPTEDYLKMPRGAPTHSVLAQARDGLRPRLRSALAQASLTGATVVVDDARVRRSSGFYPITFSVVPMRSPVYQSTLFTIVFDDRAVPARMDRLAEEGARIGQLEGELSATKEEMQSTFVGLETVYEELSASTAEIEANNDHLTSLNAVLQATCEELQRANCELTTSNRQVQLRAADLERERSQMYDVFASCQIAVLHLDHDHRIAWFSPGMDAVCNFFSGDIGRPITDFAQGGLGSHLVDDAAIALTSPAPVQRELAFPDGRWYLRRIAPYANGIGGTDGVVITYTDVSELKQTELIAAEAYRTAAASLEDRVRERTTQLRKLTAELVLTEERERRVLARDLHDGIGQMLAIIKIKLTSLEGSERRGILKRPLKEIEDMVDESNRSVRSLMLQLYPPALQTLGLISAFEWLSEDMERLYGLDVRIDDDSDFPMLEEPARTTIFRAVRELLINVAKHAQTNIAQINCQRTAGGCAAISVTDQGQGFDYQRALSSPAKDSGFGLISVRERIEFIGGDLNVDSTPGYGTTITIVFPANEN